jgi:hypothetical protein
VNLSSRTAASLYQQVLFTDAIPGMWGAGVMRHQSNASRTAAHLYLIHEQI